MSAIHEALKRAQTKRDDARGGLARGFSAGGWHRAGLPPKVLWVAGAGALLLTAALVLHSHQGSPVSGRTPGNGEAGAAGRISPLRAALPETPQQGGRVADAGEYCARGVELQKAGDMRGAEKAYRMALDADPGHVDALNNLGVLHLRKGELEEARRCFEKAARLSPEYADAFYNLACLHAVRGEHDAALARLRQAVSMDASARKWAKQDPDLEVLRGHHGFEELIGDPT